MAEPRVLSGQRHGRVRWMRIAGRGRNGTPGAHETMRATSFCLVSTVVAFARPVLIGRGELRTGGLPGRADARIFEVIEEDRITGAGRGQVLEALEQRRGAIVGSLQCGGRD